MPFVDQSLCLVHSARRQCEHLPYCRSLYIDKAGLELRDRSVYLNDMPRLGARVLVKREFNRKLIDVDDFARFVDLKPPLYERNGGYSDNTIRRTPRRVYCQK